MIQKQDVKSLISSALAKIKRRNTIREKYSKHLDIANNVLDKNSANQFIIHLLTHEKPCMIARFGSTELSAMLAIERLNTLSPVATILESLANTTNDIWKTPSVKALQTYSGFFPVNKMSLNKFLAIMIDSIEQLDLLGSWTEQESRFTCHRRDIPACKLSFLEPYFHEIPWSSHLEGTRVLVIHPFADLITRQFYQNRQYIFPGRNVLSDFNLLTLKAVQTLAGEQDPRFRTWFDALDWMIETAMKLDFDTAIIGCGAYGFPLAAQLKKLGKKTVHLGGATQILFGIAGKRWDARPEFTSMYNQFWVRPGSEGRPSKYKVVEDGCYW